MISQRLARVASFVPQGARLLDVGSDHAYLPIYLVGQGKIQFAVAGEVVAGPFESAQKNVQEEGLTQQIEVRLANGLAALEEEDQLDTLVIAGMGGRLISDILRQGRDRLSGLNRLILQPNNGQDELRSCLEALGFEIVAEDILEEAGKFYEIIVAEPGQTRLNQKQVRFGPCLLLEKSPVFQKRWTLELTKLKGALAKIPSQHQSERSALSQKIGEIEEVLHVSK
ncbi:tRNA (adenine(22)-N(1))-methyltransferase [Streptococcus oricebi]